MTSPNPCGYIRIAPDEAKINKSAERGFLEDKRVGIFSPIRKLMADLLLTF
jgi:hypothetical protein